MKKIDSPCLNCSNRCVGCHSCCPEYIDYSNMMQSIPAEIQPADKMLIDMRRRIKNYISMKNKRLK